MFCVVQSGSAEQDPRGGLYYLPGRASISTFRRAGNWHTGRFAGTKTPYMCLSSATLVQCTAVSRSPQS